MAKTIMISDDIYKALTQLKRSGESYTQLIARYVGLAHTKKKSLLECAGLWRHLTKNDIANMENAIEKTRKSWRAIKW